MEQVTKQQNHNFTTLISALCLEEKELNSNPFGLWKGRALSFLFSWTNSVDYPLHSASISTITDDWVLEKLIKNYTKHQNEPQFLALGSYLKNLPGFHSDYLTKPYHLPESMTENHGYITMLIAQHLTEAQNLFYPTMTALPPLEPILFQNLSHLRGMLNSWNETQTLTNTIATPNLAMNPNQYRL